MTGTALPLAAFVALFGSITVGILAGKWINRGMSR